jgi:hypothetical protein
MPVWLAPVWLDKSVSHEVILWLSRSSQLASVGKYPLVTAAQHRFSKAVDL